MNKRRRVGIVVLVALLPLSIFGFVNRQSIGNYVLRIREKLSRHSAAFPVYHVSSSHNRNPNPADLAIPKDEDLALLNDVVQTIFPNGTDGLSEEEMSIEILKYASSALILKSNKGSATKMLKEGFTLCGGMSSIFVMLCRKIGLPARSASAKYMPSFSEHVVSEVFYGNKWHLFDPTFGIFFYTRPDYDMQGDVISFHEFLSNPNTGTAFKVVSRPWNGAYDQQARDFDVTLVEDDYLKSKYGDSVIKLYRKEMQEAFPIGFGAGDLISYPVDVNLLEVEDLWFGKNDNSYDDLNLFTTMYSSQYRASFFGSYYLGEFAMPAFHTWVIKTPTNSSITIEYYCANDYAPKLALVPLRSVRLVETRSEDRKTTFTILANDEEAILSVYCPEGTFFVDSMHTFRR